MECNGRTPLDDCLQRPDPCPELVRILCQEDSPRNRRSLLGLMQSFSVQKLPILRLMLDKGVRPDCTLQVPHGHSGHCGDDNGSTHHLQQNTASGRLSRFIALEKLNLVISCDGKDGESKDSSASSGGEAAQDVSEEVTGQLTGKGELDNSECPGAQPNESAVVTGDRSGQSSSLSPLKGVRTQSNGTLNSQNLVICKSRNEQPRPDNNSGGLTCWEWLLKSMAGFINHGMDKEVCS